MQTPSQYTDFVPHAPSGWQAFCGLVVSMWVITPAAMQALLILMCFDFATGMIAAGMEGRFHLREAWRGLMRKGLTVWLVLMVRYAAHISGATTDVSSGIAMMFVAYEFCSGVRNCARAGVPIPGPLVAFMTRLRQTFGSSESASDNAPGKSSQVIDVPAAPPGSSMTLETQSEVVIIPPADKSAR